jgi:tRNA A-37 threonylcarbamoyl transferase component Bud32
MNQIPETKLPMEKEFLHLTFCQMIDSAHDIKELKNLIKELHHAYIVHQDVTNIILRQKLAEY